MSADRERRVTLENLGAWLVRCDPQQWDMQRFRADGHSYLARWSVHPSYRTDLMIAGQAVVLWLGGGSPGGSGRGSRTELSGRSLGPGLWGVGQLTGSPSALVPDPFDQQAYWQAGAREHRPELYVPMHLPLLSLPISRDRIAGTEGLQDLEVLRARQMSNPSFLTRKEWALLQGQLPLLPANDPPVVRDDAVELAAVVAVTNALESDGWKVLSVEKENLGWDLTARRDGQFRCVEVKGRGPRSLTIRLTRNEVQAARDNERWELAVVPDALGAAPVHWFERHTALDAAEPTSYQAVLDVGAARA